MHPQNNLSFSHHCAVVGKKAATVANLLLRSFRCKNPELYATAFDTYVRPILEYASPVWSPRFKKDINHVENVLKSYTKRVCHRCNISNNDYEARLNLLNLECLSCRRAKFDLVMLYNICHNNVNLKFTDFFITTQTQVTTRAGTVITPKHRPDKDYHNLISRQSQQAIQYCSSPDI